MNDVRIDYPTNNVIGINYPKTNINYEVLLPKRTKYMYLLKIKYNKKGNEKIDLEELLKNTSGIKSWNAKYNIGKTEIETTLKKYIYSRDTYPILRDMIHSAKETTNIEYYYRISDNFTPILEYCF